MRVIDEAFTQIKDASGITDIEEIMNTFIKSEEQNYSLYNYVDILSQEIDTLVNMHVICRLIKMKISRKKLISRCLIMKKK